MLSMLDIIRHEMSKLSFALLTTLFAPPLVEVRTLAVFTSRKIMSGIDHCNNEVVLKDAMSFVL